MLPIVELKRTGRQNLVYDTKMRLSGKPVVGCLKIFGTHWEKWKEKKSLSYHVYPPHGVSTTMEETYYVGIKTSGFSHTGVLHSLQKSQIFTFFKIYLFFFCMSKHIHL